MHAGLLLSLISVEWATPLVLMHALPTSRLTADHDSQYLTQSRSPTRTPGGGTSGRSLPQLLSSLRRRGRGERSPRGAAARRTGRRTGCTSVLDIVICGEAGWGYEKTLTARKLIVMAEGPAAAWRVPPKELIVMHLEEGGVSTALPIPAWRRHRPPSALQPGCL